MTIAPPDDRAYRRATRSWILYDWANSAFVTTVVAAVLPVYYSSVAGATLPSAARATQAFSLTTSIALGVTALVSPLLGAYSDLMAAKKRLLALFVGIGATVTALLVLVDEGDWLLASALFVVGRLGFGAANVLYDALLPHVARPEDQDRVSAQGYALGYLGGGLLLAVNVGLILALPDGNLGVKLSFASVAVWWVVFTLPLLRNVAEPPAAARGAETVAAEGTVAATVRQVRVMLRDLGQYVQLRRFLLAYLIYNDGINVVIGVAALYGAELGFASTELLLAILLVQFSGVPYSLAFGRFPAGTGRRHARIVAFVIGNVALLPVLGLGARALAPGELVGRAGDPYVGTATAAGQGEVDLRSAAVSAPGATTLTVAGDLLDREGEITGLDSPEEIALRYVGRDVEVGYVQGPGRGVFAVLLDGTVVLDGDEPLTIDASNPVVRYGETVVVPVATAGEHELALAATGDPGEHGAAGLAEGVAVTSLEVLAPPRDANLGVVLALILALQVVVGLLAFLLGPPLLGSFADRLDTRGSILLALSAYFVVAVWGFVLDTVVEFWALAWLVSVVQGGSQALSRSLYAALVPPERSGEFFGLFSILAKFASFISPLLFVISVAIFDSSRPAVLALGAVFALGIALLRRVDVARGRADAAAGPGAVA